MWELWRASWVSVATISAMNAGTLHVDVPDPPSGRASWRDDRHLGLDVERVVGADLGAEAVLQRRDDPAAVRVVLGVGRGERASRRAGRRIL